MCKKQIKLSILMTLMLTIIISTNVFASSPYTRLAGVDRYETSAKIALNGWTQSDYAVLALGQDYPDALCAAPLAGKYKAPILLTETNSIPASTLATIKQLQVKSIFIVGGTGAISQVVQDKLIALGIKTIRLAGQTRYETDIAVAKQLGTVSQIAVVTGEDYADALSIAPIAVKLNMPIILVGKDSIPQSVTDYIATQAITKTYVIGKGTSIKDGVGLPNVTEINGADKYARNISIISAFKDSLNFSTIYLATGENFADALSGSVLAGLSGSPLILVGSDITNQENLLHLVAPNATIKILGGTGAVHDSTLIGIGENGTTTPPAIKLPVETSTPPTAPTKITASVVSGNSVMITWNAVANASSYNVYSCNDNISYKVACSEKVTQAQINVSSASLSKPTYFVVTSIVNGVESGFSWATSVPVISSTPSVVTSAIPVQVSASLVSNNSVRITWNPIANAGIYNVYCSLDGVTYTEIGCSGLNAYHEELNTISSLAGTTKLPIYFKVTSMVNGVESGFSAVTSVTPIITAEGEITGKISKISKISIISTCLSYDHDAGAYATYEVYDQNGKNITNDSLTNNLTFQSSGGTVTGRSGLLRLTGVNFAQVGTVILTNPSTGASVSVPQLGTFVITVIDPITNGVTTSVTLQVLDFGNETNL